MTILKLKPTHKHVQNYYAALRQFDDLGVSHEGAVKTAFQALLEHCAHQHSWTLVPEWEIRRPRQHPLRVDGALERVIDQYQVSTDKRSGITNDPNRPDDPEYIVRLISQVITASLGTAKIVNALPGLK